MPDYDRRALHCTGGVGRSGVDTVKKTTTLGDRSVVFHEERGQTD